MTSPSSNRGNRTARGCFRRDVTSHQSTRGPGETAVRQQCHRIAETCTHQRRRHAEHLPHARTAARTFVANDQHIPSSNTSLLHRCERGFFTVENARRSAVMKMLVSRNFDHASFGSEIPFQDHEAASRLDRPVERTYDFLRRRFVRGFCLIADTPTADGESASVQ